MYPCPKCDHLNRTDAQFCSSCGNALHAAVPAVPSSTAPAFGTLPFQSAPAMVPANAAALSTPTTGASSVPVPMVPQNINVNVTTNVAPPVAPVVVMAQQAVGAGYLVRSVYFVFVGWWLSQAWIIMAWILNATILGLPLGLAMLNRVPQIATLKAVSSQTQVTVQAGAVVISQGQQAQAPFIVRALYFVLVGWWVSLLWAELAWLACITVLGLPLAFWMFDRIPALTTLARR